MDWLSAEIACLELARALADFALTWLAQSTLLILAGLTLGWAFSRWGAAAQSIVYRATLAALVLCPSFSWFLWASGITGYSLPLPPTWTRPVPDNAPVLASPVVSPSWVESSASSSHFRAPAMDQEVRGGNAVTSTDPTASRFDPSQIPGHSENPGAASAIAPAASHDLHGSTPGPAPMLPVSITPWGYVAGAFSLLWLAISAACCIRLALAWRWLARIRQTAIPADEATFQVCRELAHRLGVTAPPVLVTPFIPGPCLTGWRHPAILLPDSTDPRPLGDVLTHELAHLVRGDVAWHLLRTAMTSLFFFQPLLGYLSRRIEMTAEEVCDDWVVQQGHDRAEYALRLVETAEFAGVPMTTASVAMIAHRSILARRVVRILDRSRMLSTGTSRPLMVLILAVLGVGALAMGLVQAAPRNPSPASAIPGDRVADAASPGLSHLAESGESANPLAMDQALPSKEQKGDEFLIRGLVRTPEGKPASGAKISIRRNYWSAAVPWTPVATGTADSNGKFELRYRNSAEDRFGSDAYTLAAQATGYGVQWAYLHEIKPNQPLVINLVPEYPIKGRIVDLQGKPIAGVGVMLMDVRRPKPGENLDPWIAAVKSGAIRNGTSQKLGSAVPGIQEESSTVVQSDKDGRFTIHGVGAEHVAEIELRGDFIAYQRLCVATRAMAPLSRNLWFHSGPGKPPTKDTVYGGNFSFPAAPTRVVEGTVRDAKTGKPIAGVEIESDHLAGSNFFPQNVVRAKTDADGRYRLVGLPQGAGPHLADFNVIQLLPAGDIPYLMRRVTVPSSQGPGPQTLDLTLGQGIWITGRVTEKGTGEPVRARIRYLPFLDNPHTRNRSEFHPDGNMDGDENWIVSDREGKYRIPGLPGRAIVAVRAQGEKFITGVGASEIGGMDQYGQFSTYRAPAQASARFFHALKQIEPLQETTIATCDFELDPGATARWTILDDQGQPLAGCKIDFGPRESSKAGELEVTHLAPNEARDLFLFHEERNLGKIVKTAWKEGVPLPMTVKLEKCATVKGRVTDLDGVPFKPLQLAPHPSGITQFHYVDGMLFTKPDGTFEFPHLPTGCAHYAFGAMGEGIEFAMIAEKVVIQAGQTIDLGTLKFKRMK